MSVAPYLQEKLGGKIGIRAAIITVQGTFRKIFNDGTEFQSDGSQFDSLFKDGDLEGFIKMRNDRDASLAMPTLFVPSLQANMRARHIPKPDVAGTVFLKVPINKL